MYESLFIHETLVDLVNDMVDLQEDKSLMCRSRGRLELRSIENRLDTVSRMVEAVSWSCDRVSVKTRISRLRGLISEMKSKVVCDEASTVNERYEKAAAVWRSGVHRDDRVFDMYIPKGESRKPMDATVIVSCRHKCVL